MLHCSSPLKFPSYSLLRHLEGKGNYTIEKYYKFPYRIFYRHKLRMIVDLMDKNRIYTNILDYGSGPGIFTTELKRHALFVTNLEKKDVFNPLWKFDLIVCSSVLEFCELPFTLTLLKNILNPAGALIVASPMRTPLSKLYFKLIHDKEKRHGHYEILSAISKQFRIDKINTWLNLYFSVKARLL